LSQKRAAVVADDERAGVALGQELVGKLRGPHRHVPARHDGDETVAGAAKPAPAPIRDPSPDLSDTGPQTQSHYLAPTLMNCSVVCAFFSGSYISSAWVGGKAKRSSAIALSMYSRA